MKTYRVNAARFSDAIKIHIGKFSNDGTDSADFRGDGFVGAENGDHHTTIFERDPATPEAIDLVLRHGPKINAGLDGLGDIIEEIGMIPAGALQLSEVLTGVSGLRLRIGVWDE